MTVLTPFVRQWKTGDIEAIKISLSKTIDINARGGDLNETLLHCAARNNRTEIVNLLLSKGADVNARDNDNRTPLHWAAYYGNTEIVNLLLSKGADVNARDNENRTALHDAAVWNDIQRSLIYFYLKVLMLMLEII